jgi:hypothetical protein
MEGNRMGMKVSTIVLKDVEVVELEDGSFEKRFINPKKYPAFLTNRSLAAGRNLGITKSSLIGELVKLQSLSGENGELDMKDVTPEQADLIDAENYLPVIYLGIKGANKSLELSYEEFLDKYHEDIEQVLNDYVDLIMPYLQQNSNEFKKGLEKSTSKK